LKIVFGATDRDSALTYRFILKNIWHRLKEPTEAKEKLKWKKYGKYELKGRSAMKAEADKWNDF
jgi:hypothetical protein